MQNSDFLRAVFGGLEEGQYLWTASFRADPNSADADWAGRLYTDKPAIARLLDARSADNNFYCTAVLSGTDENGKPRRVKPLAVRLGVLVADDVNPQDLIGSPSYIIETSPNKFQAGVRLDPSDPDVHDMPLVDAVMHRMAEKGLVPKDASGNNLVRYVRLPVGTNTKQRETGPFSVRLAEWNDESYSLADAAGMFGIDLDDARQGVLDPAVPMPPLAAGTDTATLLAALSAEKPNERTYHESLLRLSSKLVASGMAPGAVVEHVRGVMLAVQPTEGQELARWQARFDEIPRMVAGAEKFAPAQQQKVELALAVLRKSQQFLLSLDELATIAGNVSWLVKGMIPADSMGILFGASGTYKSFVALDLCLHMAHGMNWLDRRSKQGSVLYVASEGGAGIHRRVMAWHKERGLEPTGALRVCITPLLLSEEEQLKFLADEISKLLEPPSLIVIDTLSQTFSGDENAASDIGDYLRNINSELRARFNSTVLIIHHTGHAASERPRGSSALTANVDFMLGIFRPDPAVMTCVLETHKQKDGDRAQGAQFDLKRHVLGTDSDGDEISSLAAVHNDAVKMFVNKVKAKLNKYEEALLAYLAKPRKEPDMLARLTEMAASKEAGRMAFTRAFKSLKEQELIEMAGIGVWKKKGAS